MNWIKNNTFLACLAIVTTILCLLLASLVTKWTGAYGQTKASFDDLYAQVATSENTTLYPTPQNRDGKAKALESYREHIEKLRGEFEAYRPAELKSIQPQVLTDKLKEATDQIVGKFNSKKAKIPEDFFLGFETYKNQLAQSMATGLLAYQLDGSSLILSALAEAEITELYRIYREPLSEESNVEFKPEPHDAARYLPIELSFKASESSLRKFLDQLGTPSHNYYILRTIAIKNSNPSPPKITDAIFDETNQALDQSELPNDSNSQISFEESASDNDNIESDENNIADSSKILSQVLGNEELNVFIRLDQVLFMPNK